MYKMCIMLNKRRKYKKQRFHRNNIYQLRHSEGAYYTLIPKLRGENEDGEASECFYNYFRMHPSHFDELFDLITPHVKQENRNTISSGEKLAVTLRLFQLGSMVSIGYNFRLSKTNISNIIREITGAIWKGLSNKIFRTYTETYWREVVEGFNKKNFANCLGAFDGKHVIIQAFANGGSKNFNYKNTHSVILMAMCDASYRFTMFSM